MVLINHEEFIKRASVSSPTVTVIGVFTKTDELINCKCNNCGYIWDTKAFNLLYDGTSCPSCRKKSGKSNIKLTHDEFVERAGESSPSINIISTYISSTKDVSCSCKKCGYTWNTKAGNVLRGTNCSECRKKTKYRNIKKTHEEFMDDLLKVTTNIEILSEYQTAIIPVKCLCKVCGYEWSSRPSNLLTGYGCKMCGNKRIADKQRKSVESVISEVHSVFPHIDVVGKYISSRIPTECRCNKCGTIWKASVGNLRRGEGCPHCVESHGERMIRKYLVDNSIRYVSQKRFDGLFGVGGGKLSYDFFLPDYNILIEFQGIQHKKPVSKFGGDEQFSNQIEHDNRKRKFAEENGYALLEIWYYEKDNIETILNDFISIKLPVTITA